MQLRTLIPRVIRRPFKRLFGRGGPVKARQREAAMRKSGPGRTAAPTNVGPVLLLSVTPPLFLSGLPFRQHLGIAEAFTQRHGGGKAGFIIFPTWSIEQASRADAIARSFVEHTGAYPEHRFCFMCNTQAETTLLADRGLRAVFLSKNFTVSEQIFRPLSDVGVEFDAVYNARFVPEKRHELAAAIPKVGYITYIDVEERRREQFRRLCPVVLARNPEHLLLNDLEDGLPVAMSHGQVNAALGRAAVGLILSEVEGSSYATVEYLLAGLPVVSTPSLGGRDLFLDPEFCIVCQPDPAAVRDAVAELRARNIPREVVRARTMARIRQDRERFLSLVDDMIEELGGYRRYAGMAWPFGHRSGVMWRLFEEHLDDFDERQRASRGEPTRMPAGAQPG